MQNDCYILSQVLKSIITNFRDILRYYNLGY